MFCDKIETNVIFGIKDVFYEKIKIEIEVANLKHYEKMLELGCFSIRDIEKLTGSRAAAMSILYDYQKKGFIERVKHDRYVVISLETKQPVLSRYQIGMKLFPGAFISHHSAFEVYGYANQVFYETYVTCESRFSDFEYDGIYYHRMAPKHGMDVTEVSGVKVAGVEQTVVDMLNSFEKNAGLEETLRCMELIPSLNCGKLLDALAVYGNGFLYQKCGLILEQMNDTFLLPKTFFDECKKKISGSKRYLMKEYKDDVKYYERWNLYAPDHIGKLIGKGVDKSAV